MRYINVNADVASFIDIHILQYFRKRRVSIIHCSRYDTLIAFLKQPSFYFLLGNALVAGVDDHSPNIRSVVCSLYQL